MGDRYRVRWANVRYGNGYTVTRQRMCIAERKSWLGWWPVSGGDWHFEEAPAISDIEADKELRKPFPPTKYLP